MSIRRFMLHDVMGVLRESLGHRREKSQRPLFCFFPEFLQSGGLLCLGKWETWKDDGRFLEFGDKKQEQNAAVK